MDIVKAHAYGNDFLYLPWEQADGRDLPGLARDLCERHTGVGADGLIVFRHEGGRTRMRLLNADGSPSEVSGNGVRGLAALMAERLGLHVEADAPAAARPVVVVETDAGEKRLTLLAVDRRRYKFCAAMGAPEDIEETVIDVLGEPLRVSVLRVGNPQCVRLEQTLSVERMQRLGPAIEHHPRFPARTNVEFAVVESPRQVRILIWERGVGPTMASGTGACAAAVAAAAHGGASRDVEVIAPGGTQRVEWREDGLYLTGWASIVCNVTWIP
jgi:diaminopimelate epimerase